MRMKKCFVFFALFLLTVSAKCAFAEVFVPNGSFEYGKDFSWNYTDFKTDSFSNSLNNDYRYVHDGEVSLKLLFGEMSAGDKKTIISNAYEASDYAETGTEYELTAWFYPECDFDVNITYYHTLAGTTAKQRIYKNRWNKLVFPMLPKKTERLQFLINFNAVGDVSGGSAVYLDDVDITIKGEERNKLNFELGFSDGGSDITWKRYSEASVLTVPCTENLYVRTDTDLSECDTAMAVYDSGGVLRKLMIYRDGAVQEINAENADISSGDSIRLFFWKHGTQFPVWESVSIEQSDSYKRTFDRGTDGFSAAGGSLTCAENALVFSPSEATAAMTLNIPSSAGEGVRIVSCDMAITQNTGGVYKIYVVYRNDNGDEISVLSDKIENNYSGIRQFEADMNNVVRDGIIYRPSEIRITAEKSAGSLCRIDNFAVYGKYGEELPSLKESFSDMYKVGTAMSHYRLTNAEFLGNVKKHYNIITPEGSMLPTSIYKDGEWDFTNIDKLVNYCTDNNLEIIGHALIWEQKDYKKFLTDESGNPISKDEALAVMKNIIETMMYRYKDKVCGWDVVNEAASAKGSTTYYDGGLWCSIIGEDYVEYAFKYAAEAADRIEEETGKHIELYYNDYFDAYSIARCKNILTIVNRLLEEGCRVDAIGIQSHYDISTDFEKIKEQYEKIKQLGITVNISELDVSAYDLRKIGRPIYENALPKSVESMQTELYQKLFDYFRKNSSIIGHVTTWGMTDRHSFRHTKNFDKTDYPLLFDYCGQPKAALLEWLETSCKIQQGMIKDSGFDNGIDGWTQYGSGTLTSDLEWVTEKDGNKCLKAGNRSGYDTGFQFNIAPFFNVYGLGTYRISFKLRADDNADYTEAMMISVLMIDKSNLKITKYHSDVTNDWKEYTVDFEIDSFGCDENGNPYRQCKEGTPMKSGTDGAIVFKTYKKNDVEDTRDIYIDDFQITYMGK